MRKKNYNLALAEFWVVLTMVLVTALTPWGKYCSRIEDPLDKLKRASKESKPKE